MFGTIYPLLTVHDVSHKDIHGKHERESYNTYAKATTQTKKPHQNGKSYNRNAEETTQPQNPQHKSHTTEAQVQQKWVTMDVCDWLDRFTQTKSHFSHSLPMWLYFRCVAFVVVLSLVRLCFQLMHMCETYGPPYILLFKTCIFYIHKMHHQVFIYLPCTFTPKFVIWEK